VAARKRDGGSGGMRRSEEACAFRWHIAWGALSAHIGNGEKHGGWVRRRYGVAYRLLCFAQRQNGGAGSATAELIISA